jgi:catechol 2,3-dioxygenase-like lactoylglutathione lyase family enzyme
MGRIQMRLTGIIVAALITASLSAQTNVQPPRILGIAHVAFRVGDMAKARAFYGNFLGYKDPFSLSGPDGNIAMDFIKVNDHQYLELVPGDDQSRGQLDHFALYTDDLAGMRTYLLSRNVRMRKDVHRGRVGNYFLTVQDPDGRLIEILQYTPNSLTERNKNNFMPSGRISTHITHVGISVASLGAASKFYRDILGLEEFARGSDSNGQPGWVDLRISGSDDYVEFIPGDALPSPSRLKAQNHVGLASADVQKTVASLQLRDNGGISVDSQIEVLLGGSLPPRTNLFDPDGARIEIMETSAAPGSAQ